MKKAKVKDGGFLKFSHRVVFFFVKILAFLYSRIFLGYRCRDFYKIKKGESVIVLSNHQTDFDMFCIMTSFNKPVYPIATDNIFAGKFRSKLFSHLGVIPKKKGATDVKTTMAMIRRLRDGCSILLFPEGNRYYAEFQYYITPSLAKFIKHSGATLVLFNLHGGSGISPRFKRKNRRGKFYGNIGRVLTPAEYEKMSCEELGGAINDGIRVYDSDSGERYKSRSRAEYLERMFFVCPACGAIESIYSEGARVKCRKCGLDVEYGEDLKFHSTDENFKFTRLVDWWEYQKKTVRDMHVGDGAIFSDRDVKLFMSDPFEKRKLLSRGDVSLDKTALLCGDFSVSVGDIECASVVSGRNLTFSCAGHDYTLRGGKRFNPIKYALMFNKLETKMAAAHSDKYFNLEG